MYIPKGRPYTPHVLPVVKCKRYKYYNTLNYSYMQIDVAPADIRTFTVTIRKRGNRTDATIRLPKLMIDRHNLTDKEKIVLAFMCKEDGDVDPNL